MAHVNNSKRSECILILISDSEILFLNYWLANWTVQLNNKTNKRVLSISKQKDYQKKL